MNQPEVQHMQGDCPALPACSWEGAEVLGTTLACGVIPILKGLPVGYRGLWQRVALSGAGLQAYSAHLWCCIKVLSQCFHLLVESVLKSQPQPKNNINPSLLLLPSPHTLFPALLLASHNVTKRKINVSPWSIHPGSAVPAGPAASHPAWAGISELPLNLGFLFLCHRCVGLELVCSPAA